MIFPEITNKTTSIEITGFLANNDKVFQNSEERGIEVLKSYINIFCLRSIP
jgi:hypothetical protein